MNNPFRFQRCFRGLSLSLGFTLTELLISATILSSAVAISGMGLVSIISSSTAVNEENERQDELNRALDFISAEVREAETINDDSIDPSAISEFIDTIPSNVVASKVEPIVWLGMGSSQPVIYYTASQSSSDGPWGGKQIVYRWGPQFDGDGTYIDSNIEHSILVDSLYAPEVSGNTFDCPEGLDGVDLPKTVVQNLGFYACVDSANRMASLIQVGQVEKVLGKTESMRRERQVYSRSLNTAALPLGGGDLSCTPIPSCLESSDDGDDPFEEGPDGYVVSQDLVELKFSHMGGAITCGAGGLTIPTETVVSFKKPDGSSSSELIEAGSVTERDVPKGTTVNFTVERKAIDYCSSYSVDSQFDIGTQIIALDNGQSIPYFEPFDNQSKIDQFLSDYFIDNKISIESNQKVILFEVGEIFSSNPGPAYDFQDVILLVDIIPRPKKTAKFVEDEAVDKTTIDAESSSEIIDDETSNDTLDLGSI